MDSGEIIYQVKVADLSPNRFGRTVNPPISPADPDALRASIERDGIRVPLFVWKNAKGMVVVAGNNRLKIAKELGLTHVPAVIRQFASVSEAKVFAVTDNLARRHMNTAQKAESALSLQKLMAAKPGRPVKSKEISSEMKTDAWAEAAKISGVSIGTMSQMRLVIDHGDKKLLKKVREGSVKVSAAARIVREIERADPKQRPAVPLDEPVYSCYEGSPDILIGHIERLYLKPGMRIADVTFGDGLMWRRVDLKKYDFHPSDIATTDNKMDFRSLEYDDESFDVAVFDPPFFPNWESPSVTSGRRYRNEEHRLTTYPQILASYKEGMMECCRILKPGGMLLVKCADATSNRKHLMMHISVHNLAVNELGMSVLDFFVLKCGGHFDDAVIWPDWAC